MGRQLAADPLSAHQRHFVADGGPTMVCYLGGLCTRLGMLGTTSLVVAALVLYVSYVFYREPVPEGASQPLQIKIGGFIYRIAFNVIKVLDYLGLSRDEVSFKAFVKKMFVLNKTLHDGLQYEDTTMAGVPVRVYRPEGSTDVLPGMVYFYGSGWTIGSLELGIPSGAHFAKQVNMVVVLVGYRLLPEASQQDGLDDCLKVTKHFLQSADEYSVDPRRVVVAGDSAGGTLAASVAINLRDEGFSPMPKTQLIINPAVQLIDIQLPSYQQNSNGPLFRRDSATWFFSYVLSKSNGLKKQLDRNIHVPKRIREEYAKGVLNPAILPKEHLYSPYQPPVYENGDEELWNSIKGQVLDGHLWPMMAKSHENLPEAYIFTGHYDQLRDDGFFYAHKLRQSGVKVTHYNCPVGFHGIVGMHLVNKDGKMAMDKIVSFLKNNV